MDNGLFPLSPDTEQAMALIQQALTLFSDDEKIAALNAIRYGLHQLSPLRDPADCVIWLPIEQVDPNDYNPNKMATPEAEMLKVSIREDGVTLPIVVGHDAELDLFVIVDGFHRRKVLEEMGMRYVPAVLLTGKSLAEYMASTYRHNLARGKHEIDLQAEMIKKMLRLGLTDHQIAAALHMDAEELLRLKQRVRVAEIMANAHYTQSWEVVDA